MKAPQPLEEPPSLSTIAYEAGQQAGRVREIVHALGKAADEGYWLYCMEAVERLVDPVYEHLSTLTWEPYPRQEKDPQPPKTEEGKA